MNIHLYEDGAVLKSRQPMFLVDDSKLLSILGSRFEGEELNRTDFFQFLEETIKYERN